MTTDQPTGHEDFIVAEHFTEPVVMAKLFTRADVHAAYERGRAEQAAELERLQVLLEQAEQYARDLQDEAGWNRVEEWGLRVVDPHPARKEKAGDIIRLGEESARHGPSIWAGWTTVHREVLTSKWESPDA